MTRARHPYPTPADRIWWTTTLRNILASFGEPRELAPEDIRIDHDRRADTRRAPKETRHDR